MLPLWDEIRSLSTPIVTYMLIALNVIVFVYQYFMHPYPYQITLEYGFVPKDFIQKGEFHTLITSMFIHGGFFHLAFNMLFLWIFGDNVEDVYGHIGFLIFYIACGISAALLQGALSLFTSDVPMVGASGAISGILGAYMVLFPNSRIATLVVMFFFVQIVPIPAILYIGFWFVLQLIQGIFSLPFMHMGGVAFWAHVGGFVAGYMITRRMLNDPKFREKYITKLQMYYF